MVDIFSSNRFQLNALYFKYILNNILKILQTKIGFITLLPCIILCNNAIVLAQKWIQINYMFIESIRTGFKIKFTVLGINWGYFIPDWVRHEPIVL